MELPEWITDRTNQGRFDVQRSECLVMGMSDFQLRQLTRCGLLIEAGYGSYEVPRPPLADAFAQQREHHLVRARVIGAGIKGSYLCGLSALVAHRVPVRWAPHRVHLAKNPRLQSRRTEVANHRGWGTPPIWLDGFATQPLAEALIEVTAEFGLIAGRVGADHALRADLVTTDELKAAARAWGGRAGAGIAHQLPVSADGRIESPGESELHVLLLQAKIPVTPQVDVNDANGAWLARVDFLVDGTSVALEYDGVEKYLDHRAARDEKERDLRLTRAGYHVVHIVHEDLQKPHELIGRIRMHLRTLGYGCDF